MLIPIDAVIAEVARIPRATWTSPDPAKPPVHRPRTPSPPSQVGHSPIFDDSGFSPPSSPLWREAVDAVRHRLAPSPDGAAPGGPVGMEAVAWYVSFHSSRDRWGIYVPLSSLPIVDELHFTHLPIPRAERWRIIWDTIMAHEAVHFAVDYACAWFELLHHAPLRRAMCDRMQAPWPVGGALQARSSYFEAEEALANGHVLRTLAPRVEQDTAMALRHFVRAQPPGYRDGEAAEADAGFATAAAEVLRGYLAVWSTAWNLDLGNPGLDLSRLLPLAAADLAHCPVWVVDDLDAVDLPADAVRLFRCVARITETKTFRKEARRLELEEKWGKTKQRLAEGITNGSDFKKWPTGGAGMWSVRVSDGVRAHLRQPKHGDPLPETWLACKIGGHKEMGHG